MAGENRTTVDTVGQVMAELHERVASYDFVAAVRQLENIHRDKPRVGEAVRVRDDVLRLSQNIALGFQGNALHSLTPGKKSDRSRLRVNFMGLAGSNGPLPLHYSEYADQRERHHSDPTFREFLDLFNHRMLSLFYRASVQFDTAVNFDRPDDNAYQDFLGALCGLLHEPAAERDSIANSAKRYYPGWLGASAKSPDGIVALIEDYFDLRATVREWIGGWLPLPNESIARLGLGRESVQLGRAAYIGKRVWSIRHKFIIQIGPIDRETYLSFKPGGERALAIHDLVRNYVGDEWDWDLELTLKAEEVRPLQLNREHALGFDSWTGSRGRRPLNHQSVLVNRKQLSQLASVCTA